MHRSVQIPTVFFHDIIGRNSTRNYPTLPPKIPSTYERTSIHVQPLFLLNGIEAPLFSPYSPLILSLSSPHLLLIFSCFSLPVLMLSSVRITPNSPCYHVTPYFFFFPYLCSYIVIYACGLYILCSVMPTLFSRINLSLSRLWFPCLTINHTFRLLLLHVSAYSLYILHVVYEIWFSFLISRLLFLRLPHFHYHLCISVSSQAFSSFHGCQARSYVHFIYLKLLLSSLFVFSQVF